METQNQKTDETESATKRLSRAVDAQLREWNAELDRLQAEAERKEVTAEARAEMHRTIRDLRSRLDDLAKSGSTTMERLQSDISERWTQLKKAFS